MEMKLSLYYPCKPLRINQAFGVYNDSYLKYGFSRHNGIDYAVDEDDESVAMCQGTVIETGYNEGAGNYVKYRTPLVECEGATCYVEFFYMHGKVPALVKQGDQVNAGDKLLITGATGNATGPHTHISAYSLNLTFDRIQTDLSVDRCFDFSPYYNGFYADDIPVLTPLFQGLLTAYKQLLALLLGK